MTRLDALISSLVSRRMAQWMFAYLAAAWVAAQVGALVGEQFGWSEAWRRTITMTAFTGVLPAAVLAWFHGERGAQQVSGAEALMLMLAFAIAAGAGVLAYRQGTPTPAAAATADLVGALSAADLALESAIAAPAGQPTIDGLLAALARYRKASALAPDAPRALLGQVRVALRLVVHHPDGPRQFEPVAREALGELLRISPRGPETLTAAALVAYQLDEDRMRAIDLASEALASEPIDPHLVAHLRSSLLRSASELGRWDVAREMIDRWIAREPGSVKLWRYLGEIAVVERDWSAARDAYDRAIALSQPADIELQIERSWVELEEDGDLAAWDAYLRRIEPAYGANARFIYQAWHAALSSGDFERAVALVESSRATDWPPHGKDDLLGETYFMMGDFERARRVLAPVREARELAVAAATNPGVKVWALAMLGHVRALRGDAPGAVAVLDEAFALLPPRPRARNYEMAHCFIGIWLGLAGEPARATAVLAQALERPQPQCMPNGLWLHHSTGPLRGYPPFEELMRRHGADTSKGYRPAT